MTVNAVEVYLLDAKNTEVYWEMPLENEIYAKLNSDRRLFASAQTIEDVIECIGRGFVESWWDERDGEEPTNFIRNYCEEFEYEEDYESLEEEVSSLKFSDLSKIVLLSNNEADGCRMYEAVVYDCETKIAKYSNTNAAWGKNYGHDYRDCNPRSIEFIKSLI